MRRGTKIAVIFAVIAAMIGGAVGYAFLRPTFSADRGFNFETLVKLNVYQNADQELGIYLEDSRYSTAASWAYDVINDTAARQNISIDTKYTGDIVHAIEEGFATLSAGGYIVTDGAGNLSEVTKSHAANMVATKLFEICPSLSGVEILETAYQGYDNSITNTESVNELRNSIASLRSQLEAVSTEQASLYSFIDASAAAEGSYNGLTVIAKNVGTEGNSLSVKINPDLSTEYSSIDSLCAVYRVETYLGNTPVDVQTIGAFSNTDDYIPAKIGDLSDNAYVEFRGYMNELIQTGVEGVVIYLTGGMGTSDPTTAATESAKAISELQTELVAIETLIDNVEYALNDKIDKYAMTGKMAEYATAEDLANLNVDLVAQFDSITDIESRIAELYKSVSENKEQYGDNFTSIQQSIYENINLIEEVKQEFASQMTENETLYKNIDTVTTELIQYKTEIELDMTQINKTIDTLDSTITSTLNTKYADLTESLTNYYRTLETSLGDTKSELTSSLSSTKSEIEKDLEAAKTALQTKIDENQANGASELDRFKDTTNSKFDTMADRITALENRFSLASQTTTSLIDSLITQNGTMDSTALLASVQSNATALTQELTSLHNTLTELHDFVDAQNLTSAETDAIYSKITSAISKVSALEEEVESYNTTMTNRINNFDQSVIDACSNISDTDEATQQALVEATNLLISLQKANDVYIKRLFKEAKSLGTSVSAVANDVSSAIADIHLTNSLNENVNTINQSITDNVATINNTISTLQSTINDQIDALQNDMTTVINDYIASLQAADTAITDALYGQMTVVSVLTGYTIKAGTVAGGWSDMSANGSGPQTVIPCNAITEGTQYIEVQYATNYGIEPEYTVVGNSTGYELIVTLPVTASIPDYDIVIKQVLIYSYPVSGDYEPATATP